MAKQRSLRKGELDRRYETRKGGRAGTRTDRLHNAAGSEKGFASTTPKKQNDNTLICHSLFCLSEISAFLAHVQKLLKTNLAIAINGSSYIILTFETGIFSHFYFKPLVNFLIASCSERVPLLYAHLNFRYCARVVNLV